MKTLTSKIGAVLVAILIVAAIFAPWLAPHDPGKYNLDMAFAAPSLEYPLGNDADGRDILSRIIYGARISLGIGIVVTAVSMLLGSLIGVWSGYAGGIPDKIFIFFSDVFLAFPGFLFAIAIAAFLQPSIVNVIFILCLKGWVTFARLVRGQTMSLREREFVAAGRAIGTGKWRIYLRHLFPNMIGPILVNASFGMAGVIMVESSLSFLGLGVPVDAASWGVMLDQGTKYLLIAPHLSIYPGVAIMLVVLGFNFLGDGLRDALAPKNR